MTITDPIIDLLLYIALFFAPPDVTLVHVDGPGFTTNLVRAESYWSDNTSQRLSLVGNQLRRDGEAGGRVTPLADDIKLDRDHNWTTTPRITVQGSTTLEKTPAGFLLRAKDGDSAARTYTISYAIISRPPAPPITTHATDSPRVLTINVLGAVNKPGAYPLPAGATLLDALAAAGGGTTHANTRKLSVVRGPAGEKPAVTVHDADAILRGQLTNPPLLDRDTLFVPEKIL